MKICIQLSDNIIFFECQTVTIKQNNCELILSMKLWEWWKIVARMAPFFQVLNKEVANKNRSDKMFSFYAFYKLLLVSVLLKLLSHMQSTRDRRFIDFFNIFKKCFSRLFYDDRATVQKFNKHVIDCQNYEIIESHRHAHKTKVYTHWNPSWYIWDHQHRRSFEIVA